MWYTRVRKGILLEVEMHTAKVSTKGWVVIPKDFRDKYGLEKGTLVQIVDYGEILALVPLPEDPVEALHGMLEAGSSLTADLLVERAQERTREQEHGR
jgi:AbrB family looped-hinge helix DNA binding protein